LFADGIRFRGYQPKELLLDTGKKFEIKGYYKEGEVHFIKLKQIN